MQYAEVGYGLFVCLWGASDFAAVVVLGERHGFLK